ncbi:MAG: hypothetical protein WCF96_01505 [Eubacteriales bacterium]
MMTIIYYLIIISLFSIGLAIMPIPGKGVLSLKPNIGGSKIWKFFLSFNSLENILSGTGYLITMRKYQYGRWIICILIAVYAIYFKNVRLFVILFMIYFITMPFENIKQKQTPFGLAMQFMRRNYSNKKDIEIYQSISLLRNMVVGSKVYKLSTDHIIEQLAIYSDILRHTYFKMMNLLRLNRKQEAVKLFYMEIGTKAGKDFGRILTSIDEVNPRELEEILISLQKNIREERITKQRKRDEVLSDILYLPVIVNVILIFINFIYVAYFVNQKNIFSMMMN